MIAKSGIKKTGHIVLSHSAMHTWIKQFRRDSSVTDRQRDRQTDGRTDVYREQHSRRKCLP